MYKNLSVIDADQMEQLPNLCEKLSKMIVTCKDYLLKSIKNPANDQSKKFERSSKQAHITLISNILNKGLSQINKYLMNGNTDSAIKEFTGILSELDIVLHSVIDKSNGYSDSVAQLKDIVCKTDYKVEIIGSKSELLLLKWFIIDTMVYPCLENISETLSQWLEQLGVKSDNKIYIRLIKCNKYLVELFDHIEKVKKKKVDDGIIENADETKIRELLIKVMDIYIPLMLLET